MKMNFEQYMNKYYSEAVEEFERYLERENVPSIGSLVVTTANWGVEDEIDMHCEVVGMLDETDGYDESQLHLQTIAHKAPSYVVPVSQWYRYISKL